MQNIFLSSPTKAEGTGVFIHHFPSVIDCRLLLGCTKSPALSASHGSSKEKGKNKQTKKRNWPSEVSQFSLSGESQGMKMDAPVTLYRARAASRINQGEARGHVPGNLQNKHITAS